MNINDSLETLFRELIDGSSADDAWMLNPGDVGLVRSLDTLTAAAASAVPRTGGASIAAHVDHVRYGLSLLNRWSQGDPNPWATADWTASWRRVAVGEPDWAELKAVVTGHGPASQSRLEFRRVSYAETQWVRDALLGGAAAAA